MFIGLIVLLVQRTGKAEWMDNCCSVRRSEGVLWTTAVEVFAAVGKQRKKSAIL